MVQSRRVSLQKAFLYRSQIPVGVFTYIILHLQQLVVGSFILADVSRTLRRTLHPTGNRAESSQCFPTDDTNAGKRIDCHPLKRFLYKQQHAA